MKDKQQDMLPPHAGLFCVFDVWLIGSFVLSSCPKNIMDHLQRARGQPRISAIFGPLVRLVGKGHFC